MDRDGERERERERRSSTCPPLSPSPHTNSFVIGTAVINTHTQSEGCSPVSGGRTIRLCPTSTSGRHWCRGSRRSPPPSLQWWWRLSAVERVLTRSQTPPPCSFHPVTPPAPIFSHSLFFAVVRPLTHCALRNNAVYIQTRLEGVGVSARACALSHTG